MNADTKWIMAIVGGSLLLNYVQFVVIMCLWKGCPLS